MPDAKCQMLNAIRYTPAPRRCCGNAEKEIGEQQKVAHIKYRINERLPPKHCGTSCSRLSILSFHPGKTQREISAGPVFWGSDVSPDSYDDLDVCPTL